MSRFTKIGAACAACAALLAGGSYALGADNTSSGQGSGDQGSSVNWAQVRRAQMPRFDPQDAEKRRDEFYKALGDKLGKSQDEVKAAFRSLLEDRLDQEVKDKRLTEEQEDAILKGFDAGLPGGPMIGHGHGPGGHGDAEFAPGPGGPGGPGGPDGPPAGPPPIG
jgi:hypothetical protein